MDKKYVVIVQCHIVHERCPGYFCERSFHFREGAFKDLPADNGIRMLSLTCGGCCGRAVQRKLSLLLRKIEQKEGVTRDQVQVRLASCISKDNYHGPCCPHLDYLKDIIGRLKLDVALDTVISRKSEERRQAGCYAAPKSAPAPSPF